jgi:hypothetical protein
MGRCFLKNNTALIPPVIRAVSGNFIPVELPNPPPVTEIPKFKSNLKDYSLGNENTLYNQEASFSHMGR